MEDLNKLKYIQKESTMAIRPLKYYTNNKQLIILLILLSLSVVFIAILTLIIVIFQLTIEEALSLIRYRGFWVLFFWTFLLSLPFTSLGDWLIITTLQRKTGHYIFLTLVVWILIYVTSLGISYLVLFFLEWPWILRDPILLGLFALEAKIAHWIYKLKRSRLTTPKAPTNLCLEHPTGIITLTTYTVVGKRNFSDLPEEALARLEEQHAAVYYRDGEWWVEDLGSRHGTYLNGVKIKKEKLKEGDVVNLGAVVDLVLKPCEKTPTQSLAPDTAERRRAVIKLEETEGKTTGLHHGPEEPRYTTLPGREAPDSTPTNIRNVVKLEETESADRT